MSKPARLGRCPRCKAYALVDDSDGIRLAIDIAPVDALGYGVAVASGRRLWWAETTPGRPSRVLGPLSGARNPSWGPGGSQASVQKLHAEHSCGVNPRDIAIVNVQSDTGKGSAPATPGAAGAGNHPLDAPAGRSRSTGSSSAAGSAASPSPAATATRPRSDSLTAARSSERHPRAFRCDTCNRLVDRKAEEFLAIEHDNYAWGYHLECP